MHATSPLISPEGRSLKMAALPPKVKKRALLSPRCCAKTLSSASRQCERNMHPIL